MNLEEKNNIAKLQRKGLGYRRIANELNLSPNTVKSYLKKLSENTSCPTCGKPVKQTAHRKEKRFCSDACRMKYWNSHLDEMKHKNLVISKCENCGKTIISYRKEARKYCSRACAFEGRKSGKKNS